MEQFVVSARKYRPARFDEVVGQQSVTVTLKNAIKQKQLAHAFLFCGPRGVGKTTCARILAKTINCEQPTEDFEACGTCNSCESLNKNSSLNIFEMDAASNSHVEDIRNLTEQVRYAPQNGRYKIYIIDEVHMLSTNAFNAFLKTLEEPPPYTKFILATTEKHKILPTILSRCQIFDFNRITVDDIVDHLEGICKKESISYEPEALHLIGQKADGGLRDALSIFDRMASFGNRNITYDVVAENLNVLDHDFYFKITEDLLLGDMAGLLLSFGEILKKGFEGDLFLNGLSEHFRNLLVAQTDRTLSLLETSGKLRDRYIQQAQQTDAAFLLNWANIAEKAEYRYKDSRNKRLLVELSLMKMAAMHSLYLVSGNDAVKKKTTDNGNPTVNSPAKTANYSPAPTDTTDKVSEPEHEAEPKNTPPQEQAKEEKPAEQAQVVQRDENSNVRSTALDFKHREKQEKLKHMLGLTDLNLSNGNSANPEAQNAPEVANTEDETTDDLPQIADKTDPDTESLFTIWEYALKQTGKSTIINAFDKETTKLFFSENTLTIEINGGESLLNENLSVIEKYFRRVLENPDLKGVVKKIQNSSNFVPDRPFTTEDKLKFFMKKNPDLKKLHNKLQLRIEP